MSEQTLPIEVQLVRIKSHYAANLLEEQGVDFDWSHSHFEDVIARVEAAAEQRGAEKALTDFKTFVLRVLPKGLVNRAAILADLDESMKRLDETGHLLMGPLRANHMEGDDADA